MSRTLCAMACLGFMMLATGCHHNLVSQGGGSSGSSLKSGSTKPLMSQLLSWRSKKKCKCGCGDTGCECKNGECQAGAEMIASQTSSTEPTIAPVSFGQAAGAAPIAAGTASEGQPQPTMDQAAYAAYAQAAYAQAAYAQAAYAQAAYAQAALGHGGMGHAGMMGHGGMMRHGGMMGHGGMGYGGACNDCMQQQCNVPRLPPNYYNNTQPPGPATPTYAYPYYTTRAPRDFLMANPPTIGP